MLKRAVQLYTVREEASKDFLGTLEKVAELGYEGVEFAGFFDVPAEVLKEHLDKLGLAAIGSHTPMQLLLDDIEAVIAYNKIIGNSNIICPWAKVENEEDLKTLITQLRSVIGLIQEAGMELMYHNHAHEFITIEGNYALDLLLEAFQGGLKPEVDTFWVYRAGVDVEEYLLKHKESIKLIHVKDGTEEGPMALGEGDAPVRTVMSVAEELGLEWIIIENDNPLPDGLSDIGRSMDYIKTNF